MTEALRTYRIADNDGVILIFIVMFALYALVLYRSKASLVHKWVLFFTGRKTSGGEYANGKATDIEDNIIMLFLLSVSSGFLFFDYFPSAEHTVVPYGKIFAIASLMICWLLAKSVIYWLINWVFSEFDKCRKWNTSYYFLLSMSGLIVFPLSAVKLFFQLNCSTVFLLCFILLLIYKFLLICKLTIVFKPKSYGFVLIFLYFCTIELMPALYLLAFCEVRFPMNPLWFVNSF